MGYFATLTINKRQILAASYFILLCREYFANKI